MVSTWQVRICQVQNFIGVISEKRLNHRNGKGAMKDNEDCRQVEQEMVSLVSGGKYMASSVIFFTR